ncbi:RNA polymerase sigma factor [Romboutsia ilealis]|uniref:RNA polymerase sigma factor n=1 Tax=Romboutsia faecis TaxID=2764597 RepID=A0ABR7JML4_9FIRM|nr:RNA polymerase sigma factor [Romboutsia faecis]MBC5996153.1 RNA polymerase sigma factor [Romboutsia faecis]MRN23353.1 RNA polymerase sigma factor [Romboutsia ilealis]
MKNDKIIDLYRNQSKIIVYYLMKNGCNLEDAQDIMHDSFIKAIKYIDGVDNNKISSWLFTVSMNTYKDYIKKSKKKNYIFIDNAYFYSELVDNYNLLEEYLKNEKSKDVLRVLNGMKDEYRSILIFKYDMELSYREIGLLLGLNENVVKTYMYRARNKFKEEWRKINEQI